MTDNDGRQLRATQQFLQSMEDGLAELREALLPDHPDRLDVLGQPYRDEIARLRAEIALFLGLRDGSDLERHTTRSR